MQALTDTGGTAGSAHTHELPSQHGFLAKAIFVHIIKPFFRTTLKQNMICSPSGTDPYILLAKRWDFLFGRVQSQAELLESKPDVHTWSQRCLGKAEVLLTLMVLHWCLWGISALCVLLPVGYLLPRLPHFSQVHVPIFLKWDSSAEAGRG